MPYENGVWREPNNTDRAEWARHALTAYAKETRMGYAEMEVALPSDTDTEDEAEQIAEELEEIASDFLTDLMHLLDKAGIEFDVVQERAERNHREEVEEAGRAEVVDEIVELLKPAGPWHEPQPRPGEVWTEGSNALE